MATKRTINPLKVLRNIDRAMENVGRTYGIAQKKPLKKLQQNIAALMQLETERSISVCGGENGNQTVD